MSNSDTDIDDLVVKDVREPLSEQKNGERLNVTVKTRELRVHKNRLYCRIKNIGVATCSDDSYTCSVDTDNLWDSDWVKVLVVVLA